MPVSSQSALIVLDVQKAIDLPYWGERNNLDAETNMHRILEVWRKTRLPVFHIQHNSSGLESGYNPTRESHAFKDEVVPIAGEVVIGKTVHSAFVGTDLENLLLQKGIDQLFLFGVKTNNSIETTVRHGSNLGFEIVLIEDACFTHNQVDWNRREWSASDIHAISLSNLEGEYCKITTTDQFLQDM